MAFNFGSGTSTPAPAAPTTPFGIPSATPAPAAAGQQTTGSTSSGSVFGGFTAAAPQTNPGAATSFSSFGSGTTGAATTPNPAPAFGGTSSPAPAAGGFFGSTSASTGGMFGSTTTSSSSPFGAAPSAFGTAAPQAAAAAGPMNTPMIITASTPYSSLPPVFKNAIDTIHKEMMEHKKTMANVETMAPALLRQEQQRPVNAADVAAGGTVALSSSLSSNETCNLRDQLQELQHNLEGIQVHIHKCRETALSIKGQSEVATTQSIMYGMWPVEAVANRRGVKLSTSKEKSMDPNVQARLETALNHQVTHVDRVERIPSPYMWETLQNLERRVGNLMQQLTNLNSELDANVSEEAIDVALIVHSQSEAITRAAGDVTRVHELMEQLRTKYRQTERGENVLTKADIQEYERQRRLEQLSKQQFMRAAGTATQHQAPAPSAPAPGGMFGAAAPAPSTSSFGSAPATAAFGSTPAPAPTPATGAFGQSAAPASGGTFVGAPTPAPAPGGGLFGGGTPAAPTGTPPAPSTGGFNFGGTSAPGAAPGAAPTAAPSTPATAATPRKSGSRSRNRSRR